MGATCKKCGKKLKQEEQIYCYDCSRKQHQFERGFAIFEYQDVKESLYRFKYAGRAEYADFYAKMAQITLGDMIKSLEADAFIPVPLHKRRLRKRGYNQAQEFCEKLSERLNIPTYPDYIKRIKYTQPSKRLSSLQRQNNLKRAFLITQNVVKLKTIIIIDDIYTTGATIDAISAVCKEAGVQKIYFLAVAIGNGL